MTTPIETPGGPGLLYRDDAAEPVATLLISHGAGAGVDTADLAALAAQLPAQGITVIRFEQPWKVAGRKIAGPPASLDVAFTAAAAAVGREIPLVVGGRSAGARSAARTATRVEAAALLALSFPLHPPGKPERSRLDELLGAGVPSRVIQGGRDAFGRPAEFPDDVDVVEVPWADHSFKVAKSAPVDPEQTIAAVVAAAGSWIRAQIGAG
ncbi:alpha/beta family hydrolase [Nocardioides sp. Bht2]|uniref:alpha/beta hydrolase family protein n=1 Tax=Nocardioides sp. Bht2 TaxID=3392297 RepID=UPI0039B61180